MARQKGRREVRVTCSDIREAGWSALECCETCHRAVGKGERGFNPLAVYGNGGVPSRLDVRVCCKLKNSRRLPARRDLFAGLLRDKKRWP